MLLDELKEVSMMITNSLQSDMGHQLQYVSGLALCTLGSIVSVDMVSNIQNYSLSCTTQSFVFTVAK